MKYSEKDLAALISSVETDFAEHLKKAEKEQTDLKKSETATVKPQPKEVASSTVEKSECNYDAEDLQELEKLYGGMEKAEAELHYKTLKKTLFGDSEPKVEKTEVNTVDLKKAEEDNLKKAEVENLKKENEGLKKSVDNLATALTKFLKVKPAPERKAITGVDFIAKTESDKVKPAEGSTEDFTKLSKSEVMKKLTLKAKTDLKKSDRDLINDYCDNKIKIETIKHLL